MHELTQVFEEAQKYLWDGKDYLDELRSVCNGTITSALRSL